MCFLCFCFLLPPDFWVFVYFGDIRVLRDLTFRWEKKKNTHTHTHLKKARPGHSKHVYNVSDSNSQKRRGHVDFSAGRCQYHGIAL